MIIDAKGPLVMGALGALEAASELVEYLDEKYLDEERFANDEHFKSLYASFHRGLRDVSRALDNVAGESITTQ